MVDQHPLKVKDVSSNLTSERIYFSFFYYIHNMWNIKIKWPGKKQKVSNGPLFEVPFRDYLDTIKTKNPEEEFAVRVLKSLCTSPKDYGHYPLSKTVFGIYCFDCEDQGWYTRYFAEMLKVFKPLWCNLNDRDFLKKLGIVFLKREEDAIGFNLRGVMVSKKWVDFLTVKYSAGRSDKWRREISSEWRRTMEYFEMRMQARFLNNYFIMMSSDENVKDVVGALANPRVIFDLQSFVGRTN